MERIEVKQLRDLLFMDSNEYVIEAYTTEKLIDVNGQHYHEVTGEEVYISIAQFGGNCMFVSESYLVENLLKGRLVEVSEDKHKGMFEVRIGTKTVVGAEEALIKSRLNEVRQNVISKMDAMIYDWFKVKFEEQGEEEGSDV